MDCEMYMLQPESFVQGNQVCLLEKAIYGSKQGGNRWNKKMRSVLESMAFKQSYSDASIYIYSKDGVSVLVISMLPMSPSGPLHTPYIISGHTLVVS